jgi:multidrug efflux pump subunit AcrB
VYLEIASALSTETTSTTVTLDGNSYSIVVGNGQGRRMTPEEIRNYSFTVTGTDGTEEEIFLKDIAEIQETETLSTISRENQRRYLTISAEVADGYNVTKVTSAVKKALSDYELPQTMTIEYDGENEMIMESFSQLGLMLGLGILLVYLVMAAQFQSWKSPFIVMFTIPLAFTGGLLGLLITGNELSVISLIGFVMLCGIIVNNGIVLVDYINQSRLEGVEKRAAIIDAGMTRMRPILMTSTTTILGLFVMALGVGSGTDMMQPIAIVCIGGLIYATLMTLFVIPILYEMMNRKAMLRISDEELEVSEL